MDRSFAATAGEWLAPDGPDNDVVISSRIRLARNVEGHFMPWRLSPSERRDLETDLRQRMTNARILGDGSYWSIEDLTPTERQLLVERRLISRDLAMAEGARGVLFTPTETASIMTGEEDHLRIQVLRCGLQLEESWRRISRIDAALEETITYAVSPELGYLTACPTNVGTGLRVSVMAHLPTLVQTDQIEKVHTAAAKVGLVLRGLYGEGTKASGDFFQISNQVTLGRTESEILQEVQAMVSKIVEWERGVRQLLMEQDRGALEDRVWRAWGILNFARRITSEETLQHLSSLRLGISTGLLGDVRLQAINELFLFTQPAHLQVLRGGPLEPEQRDTVRASFVRDWLIGSESS